MTAFLFIPPTSDGRLGRRIDLANIASLFAEAEEPLPRRGLSSGARIALLAALLLCAIGDTVLVTRPEALASGLASLHPTIGAQSATSL